MRQPTAHRIHARDFLTIAEPVIMVNTGEAGAAAYFEARLQPYRPWQNQAPK